MRGNRELRIVNCEWALAVAMLFPLSPRERAGVRAEATPRQSAPAVVLSEIDRHIREGFWDPKLKGVDWSAAVARAGDEVKAARTSAERDAAYDRLLATLSDSHTFRVAAGAIPEHGWGQPVFASEETETDTRSRESSRAPRPAARG